VWWCLIIPGFHSTGDGAAVPGMVAQRQGWPHRAEGDGRDALHWSGVTASSCAGAGLTSVPLSRVLPSYFEGCDVEADGSGWHSVTELTLAFPHSYRTVPGMAAQGGLAENRPRGCSSLE
jgi:hypothetical protein